MARLIKILLVFSVGSWFLVMALKQPAAQQSADLPDDNVWIAELGLEDQIKSAIDLVGPEHASAGRNRAALVYRLQCWIDGVESCSVADRNDPRVRAIRRFLAMGPADQDGAVIILFPDQTRIEVQLVRVPDLDPNDWGQSVYQPVVVPESVHGPRLPAIPSRPGHLVGSIYQ